MSVVNTYSLSKSFVSFPWLSTEGLYEKPYRDLFAEADIQLEGQRSSDLQIHNPRFYKRVLTEGSLGLGESYMEGWWDCQSLDKFFYKILGAHLPEKVANNKMAFLLEFTARVMNLQSKERAWLVGKQHYDLGNKLYTSMLDSRMIYSCGYWQHASNLEQAQKAKLDLVCRKLHLKPGMTLLDIGCGWGGMAKFAAENYGVSVLGVTISKEQFKFAKQCCKGLPIEFRLQDYRELHHEEFDRIVSIGMFEHVGYKNFRTFMKVSERCLKKEGLFLLHTIGSNTSGVCTDEWIHKYIFPNSMLPSGKQITEAIEDLFIIEDWHNFGTDYDKTLMAWHSNFCKHWNELEPKYNHRFYRMWTYYLLSCAAAFRARKNQLWQIVLSKQGVKEGYSSIR